MNAALNYTRIFFPILLLIFFGMSCKKMESEPVSWMRIDSVQFVPTPANNLGTGKHDFKDIWVYLNDNLQGTYELPAKFPIIHEGVSDFVFIPGISMNGFSGQRPIYTVVEPLRLQLNLSLGDTIKLNPVFRYDTTAVVPFNEGFEQGSMAMTKTTYSHSDFMLVNSPSIAFEGNGCGYMELSAGENSYAEAMSIDAYTLPKNGTPVYFEMHYKCNTPFIFRLKGLSSDGFGYDFDIGGINSSDMKWKKIYFAITPDIVKFALGNKFHIMLKIPRMTDIPSQELYVDNLKLIY